MIPKIFFYSNLLDLGIHSDNIVTRIGGTSLPELPRMARVPVLCNYKGILYNVTCIQARGS